MLPDAALTKPRTRLGVFSSDVAQRRHQHRCTAVLGSDEWRVERAAKLHPLWQEGEREQQLVAWWQGEGYLG